MVLCDTAAQNSSAGSSPELEGRAVSSQAALGLWGTFSPPFLAPPPFLLQGEGF